MKLFTHLLKYGATTLVGLVGLGVAANSAQAFSVTPTDDGQGLVQKILGSGISVVPGSVTYSGASGTSGIFTGGLSTGIGIDSGIILTTGQAIDALGPNDLDNTTTQNGEPGDADLDGLIPGFSTLDALTLEFDFISTGGDLFFNYVLHLKNTTSLSTHRSMMSSASSWMDRILP